MLYLRGKLKKNWHVLLGKQLRIRLEDEALQRHLIQVEFVIVVLVELDTGTKITLRINGI